MSGNSTAGTGSEGGGIFSVGLSGGGIGLANSIVLGNTTTGSGVGGDEFFLANGSNTPYFGGNIVGTNIFNGATDVGDTTAAQVFAATVTNNGVQAGALGDNGGNVQTIAIRAGGDAVGRGDATLLPADAFDLDGDSDTAETLPVDATGGPRVGGVLDLGAVEARDTPSLIVTTLTDVVDDQDGLTSLREAIAFANSQTGADTITFDSGLSGTLRLTGGELVITDAVTINGGGRITITGDAADNDVTVASDITDVALTLASGATLLDDNSRVFNMTTGSGLSTLSGLTITGGRTTGDREAGGGIYARVGLTLIDSTVSGNSTAGARSEGGGIFNIFDITLVNSTVSNNSTAGAGANGGGISAREVGLLGSTVAGNSTAGEGAEGGGLSSFRSVVLSNSTVSGNSTAGASAEGGGIYSAGSSGGNGIVLTNSILLGNTTTGSGVGGDELFLNTTSGATTSTTGGNIVGTNVFNGATDVGDTTAAQVFLATVDNNGVQAGALGDNGGNVPTIAIRTGGDAVGRGDATLLPADTLDLDSDADTTEALPVDAAGGPRVSGTLDLGAVEAVGEAASLVVTTLSDIVDTGDGQTSLREAIAFANSQAGTDAITFDSGLSGTLRLTQGELVITDAVSIDGGGRITITGDAANDDVTDMNDITDVSASVAGLLDDNSRVFNITSASAATTLSGLTITGGHIPNGGMAGAGGGGGVLSRADVTLVDSLVAGNSVFGTPVSGTGGGGVSGSTVTLTNTTVSGNIAEASGGGVSGRVLTLTNSTVSGNSTTGVNGDGGGIFSVDAVTLINSTVSGNSTAGALAEGGGVFSAGVRGSGITLTNSIVLGNTTTGSGVAGDELFQFFGAASYTGGNIVGSNIFNGATDVGDTTAAQVFATTVDNNGVQAGALGDNGGNVPTIALLAGGDAVGRGDATLLPADTLDLDSDGNTAEALPVDATGGPRVDGTLDLGAVEAPPQRPVFEGALADLSETVSLAENSPATTAVFDVDANDGNGGATDAGVSYAITAGNVSRDGDADLPFAIDAATGEITVNDPGDLDFEFTPSFALTVEANNAVATASASLTVALTDVDEVAPQIADQSFSYAENQAANAVLATVAATDNVAVTSFEITSGDPNSFFAIDSAGQITLTAAGLVAAANDFETGPNSFPLTVTARDAAGNTSSPATVTLTVSDEADSPLPNTPPSGSTLVQTISPGETLQFNLQSFFTDPDGDLLTIDVSSAPAQGTLTEIAPDVFEFAASNTFLFNDSFTFTANDNRGGVAQGRIDFVGDADQDGVADIEDNALFVANPLQTDTDGDNYGNVIDADFDQDLDVDFIDFSAFAAGFGGNDLRFDLNEDGTVDFFDFSRFAELDGTSLEGPSFIDFVNA
ncbi:MAG: cadherin repeat domain-containing protein [Pseudomonadota bacterium]